MSTSRSLCTQTFFEATGRGAGDATATCMESKYADQLRRRQGALQAETKADRFYPFANEASWSLAKFFFEQRMTKTAIEAYLKSEDIMANQKEEIMFLNAEHYRQLVHNGIPWGIYGDGWTVDTLRVPSNVDMADDFEYKIYYRDVIEVVRFLMGHKPFKDNLTWAPIRVEDEDHTRVYNEMHTGEWWWETQSQIPIGGTIVPIILASDETVMTQHHGDLSLWPVYITIGNLDCATRKAQKRPGLLLLGLLPRMKLGKETADEVRSEVYHLAIGRMLQRMFNLVPQLGNRH